MMKILLLGIILSTAFIHGQSFDLDRNIKLTVKLPNDWVTDYKLLESPKGSYRRLSISKIITTSERKFLDIQVLHGDTISPAIADQRQFGCDFGRFVSIDTILISGYKAIRWFGENCNWTKETNDNEIVGYSIDSILELKKEKYVKISASYFSKDAVELKKYKDEVLTFLSDINIYSN